MKAKLTESHDWIRVVVVDDAKRKLSLTVSRRGETCSGSVDVATLKNALDAFGGLIKIKSGGSMGDRMRRLHAHAERSDTIDAYVSGIKTL